MPSAVETLIATLDLEPLEQNLFRGTSPQVGWQRVFGGQVIGQSLVAAIRTVEPSRPVHSLHGYFMLPGDPKVPIIYEVTRDRDGGSFSTRRVIAIQHGQPIFSMSASFHAREEGFDHAAKMPAVPGPDDLMSVKEILAHNASSIPEPIKRYFQREQPIELRPCDVSHYIDPPAHAPGIQNVWFRAVDHLPDDETLHRCVLAYASDMTLLDTSLIPHGMNIWNASIMAASLDHALWFHRSFRADDWLLYSLDTPSAMGARGFNRGLIFSRDGRLIASTAQEGLIRVRREIKK